MNILEIIATVLVAVLGLLGLIFLTFAVIGMYRFGSVLNRIHAIVKCGFAGTFLLSLALIVLGLADLESLPESLPGLTLRLGLLGLGLTLSLTSAGRLLANLEIRERRENRAGSGLYYDELVMTPEGRFYNPDASGGDSVYEATETTAMNKVTGK